MKKRFTALVLSCLLLVGSVQVFAVAASQQSIPQITIQPQWINVALIQLSMSYSGGNVNWSGLITGNSNTASIVATYKLEQINGNTTTIKGKWPDSTYTSTFLFSSNSAAATQGIYMLSVSAVVTNTSGVSETVTDFLIRSL